VLPLGKFRYHKIRGIDFYNHSHAIISRYPNVNILKGNVESITDTSTGAIVVVNGVEYGANYVFDSILNPSDLLPETLGYHFLKQHFLGWEIETQHPAFDPQTPTLFDFRTPQNQAMRFIYLLPESPTRALVEYTLFSQFLLTKGEYEDALRNYLIQVLNIPTFHILDIEQGSIPMTDMPFPRAGGKHILNIGTKGGRVKPSSGFAFWRIQEDTHAIIQSLIRYNHPFLSLPPI
jgi:lycopene beta-cyclase